MLTTARAHGLQEKGQALEGHPSLSRGDGDIGTGLSFHISQLARVVDFIQENVVFIMKYH